MKKILLIFLVLLPFVCTALETIELQGETRQFQLLSSDGIDYISTDQLMEFDIVLSRFFTPTKNKESQKWHDKTITFTPFSPFLVIDKEAYSLGLPTFADNTGHYVPLWGLVRVINSVTDLSMKIIKAENPVQNREEPDYQTQAPKIWKIIVDPGHGGKDPGAIGKDGTFEKDIVLDIAKKIKALSKNQKYCKIDIELTRSTDIFLPLQSRGIVAQEKKGHVFVSIHCNASKKESPKGVETFFLSPAKTTEDRATELLENSATQYEQKSEEIIEATSDFIFADFLQNEYVRESSRLADFITSQIVKDTEIQSRDKSSAGFFVLKDVVMPAVLVEVAFISNPEEEKLLKKDDFREKLAESILDGIVSFTKEFDE